MAGSLVLARCKGLSAVALCMTLSTPSIPARAATLALCPADLTASPARVLAHSMVTGAAGPFAKARVTLIRSDNRLGPFTGRLDVESGQCFLLVGPDDPTGLFDFFVKSIVFTPLGPRQPNGIVVLYDETHRSPNPDTYPGVLVYGVDERGATRLAALEQCLEGVRSAVRVRQRLRPGKPPSGSNPPQARC